MSSTIPERKTRMCSEYGLARITSSDVWIFLSINLDISHSNFSCLKENFLVFKHLKVKLPLIHKYSYGGVDLVEFSTRRNKENFLTNFVKLEENKCVS